MKQHLSLGNFGQEFRSQTKEERAFSFISPCGLDGEPVIEGFRNIDQEADLDTFSCLQKFCTSGPEMGKAHLKLCGPPYYYFLGQPSICLKIFLIRSIKKYFIGLNSVFALRFFFLQSQTQVASGNGFQLWNVEGRKGRVGIKSLSGYK